MRTLPSLLTISRNRLFIARERDPLQTNIRGTRDLSLTLEAEEAMVAKWWIDASFAGHPDYRSHPGAAFRLGKGTSYVGCHKQKLNGKSSTEAKIRAVDDFLRQVL